ncbi:MAG TPA: 5-carboxymethyl-2-hydroxymuconate Delta-isomerase [Aliiroseovarius sp.]|nr:5-carboxymethyl-2-hydroxymuconate Delta-isomerase [Aliiroseovarius sp.]
MPHLSFEYSRGLETHFDPDAFAAACRDALLATGKCPPGGIRVRGFQADAQAIADGRPGLHFLDMVLRLGAGRGPAVKQAIGDGLYRAAEGFLRPVLGDMPFILSLEIREIDPELSWKNWSTIHAALKEEPAP